MKESIWIECAINSTECSIFSEFTIGCVENDPNAV